MPDDRAQDVTPAEPGTVIGHYEVLGGAGPRRAWASCTARAT